MGHKRNRGAGGQGKLRLAKEAKEKRKERGSKQRKKEGLPAKKEE